VSTTRKKGFEVYKASKRAWDWDSIHMDGRTMDFGKQTKAFYTEDPGLAREIESKIGKHGTGDVVVCEVDNPGTRSARRSFIINAPWKRSKDV
jgi:hypothetical protein